MKSFDRLKLEDDTKCAVDGSDSDAVKKYVASGAGDRANSPEALPGEVAPSTCDASNIGLMGGSSDKRKVRESAALSVPSREDDPDGRRDAVAT